MARFRTNPSRDVLTPQMRESMYRILEGEQREKTMQQDMKRRGIDEEFGYQTPSPIPARYNPTGEPSAGILDPLEDGAAAGTDVGGSTALGDMQDSQRQLMDEVDAKFDAGGGSMPAEAMPYDGPATGRPVQPRGTRSSTDPIIDWVRSNTINWEARRDRQGNIAVYDIPAGDFGGSREVAGITDKYHPEAFKRIASMAPQDREPAAAAYVVEYAAPIANAVPEPLKPYAVDLVFNRGPGGFTSLVQRGLNQLGQPVKVDGGFGAKTLNAIESVNPVELVKATERAYREREAVLAQNNPARMRLLPGINNRSTKREAEAIRYIQNYYANTVSGGSQVAVGMGASATGSMEGAMPNMPFYDNLPPNYKPEPDPYSPRQLGLKLG